MKTVTTGKIISVSGATVRTDLTGLTLFERVSVGEQNMTGEVVRLEKDSAVCRSMRTPVVWGSMSRLRGLVFHLKQHLVRGCCQ
jgi:hypothetical protein